MFGHLGGTAFLFATLLSLAWSVAYLVHFLDSRHKFPEAIYKAVVWVEVALFWFDVLLSSFVLLVGAWQFLRDLVES